MRTKSPMELIDLVNQGLAIVDIARQVVEMLERLRAPGAVSIRTMPMIISIVSLAQGCWQRSAWSVG